MKITIESGVTNEGIKFYENSKDLFGEFVSAEMIANKMRVEYKLILTDDEGETMVFDGCLSSGYSGEGSRGTLKILKDAGFNVSEDFIQENENFKIFK